MIHFKKNSVTLNLKPLSIMHYKVIYNAHHNALYTIFFINNRNPS